MLPCVPAASCAGNISPEFVYTGLQAVHILFKAAQHLGNRSETPGG